MSGWRTSYVDFSELKQLATPIKRDKYVIIEQSTFSCLPDPKMRLEFKKSYVETIINGVDIGCRHVDIIFPDPLPSLKNNEVLPGHLNYIMHQLYKLRVHNV